MTFATERRIPLTYKGITLDCAYRLDLLVESGVIVEVKAITALLPIHQAQLLTYLTLANLPVGLLINFQVDRLVKGVKRVINPRWQEGEARPFDCRRRRPTGYEGT